MTGFTNLTPHTRELTPDELALLAQKIEPTFVTIDDFDETEAVQETPAPTLH